MKSLVHVSLALACLLLFAHSSSAQTPTVTLGSSPLARMDSSPLPELPPDEGDALKTAAPSVQMRASEGLAASATQSEQILLLEHVILQFYQRPEFWINVNGSEPFRTYTFVVSADTAGYAVPAELLFFFQGAWRRSFTITVPTGASGSGRSQNFTVAGNAPGNAKLTACSGNCLIEEFTIVPHDEVGDIPANPNPTPTPGDTEFLVTDGQPDLFEAGTPTGQRSLYRFHRPETGSLKIKIPITRIVGETDGSGKLVDPARLIQNGVISKTVKLSVSAWDVDSDGDGLLQPEVDRVFFNGVNIGARLLGTNEEWSVTDFEIPVDLVRFGRESLFGGSPSPGENELEIFLDTDNGDVYPLRWATGVDWASLSFKAMSPVVLVHGIGSEGEFFERQGFTRALTERGIPHDNSVSLGSLRISVNAADLANQLPGIVSRYGVDSIHIVAHSKGGLDTRSYLMNYQPGNEKKFKVLSYTSLSTPHNGSMLANVLVERRRATWVASNLQDRVVMMNFPRWTETIAIVRGRQLDREGTSGYYDLTTQEAMSFNYRNVPGLLHSETLFHTVAGDADRNGNGQIDDGEYDGFQQEIPLGGAIDFIAGGTFREVTDAMYQILRRTKDVTVQYHTEKLGPLTQTIAVVSADNRSPSLGNDIFVTEPSGHGDGHFGILTHKRQSFIGVNHASVASAGIANTVIEWIMEAESTKGDMQQ
jgi:triacylglycerol lipase